METLTINQYNNTVHDEKYDVLGVAIDSDGSELIFVENKRIVIKQVLENKNNLLSLIIDHEKKTYEIYNCQYLALTNLFYQSIRPMTDDLDDFLCLCGDCYYNACNGFCKAPRKKVLYPLFKDIDSIKEIIESEALKKYIPCEKFDKLKAFI